MEKELKVVFLVFPDLDDKKLRALTEILSEIIQKALPGTTVILTTHKIEAIPLDKLIEALTKIKEGRS